MIEKVRISDLPKIPYYLPKAISVMVSCWRGFPPQPNKDEPRKHEGYGVVDETIILLKGKMSITAGDDQ